MQHGNFVKSAELEKLLFQFQPKKGTIPACYRRW